MQEVGIAHRAIAPTLLGLVRVAGTQAERVPFEHPAEPGNLYGLNLAAFSAASGGVKGWPGDANTARCAPMIRKSLLVKMGGLLRRVARPAVWDVVMTGALVEVGPPIDAPASWRRYWTAHPDRRLHGGQAYAELSEIAAAWSTEFHAQGLAALTLFLHLGRL